MRRLTARTEIDRFVARCVEATARPDPAPAIERDLRRLVADPGGVLRSLPGDGDEETVLHASDGLTVVRVDGDLFVGTPRSLWVPGTHERRP